MSRQNQIFEEKKKWLHSFHFVLELTEKFCSMSVLNKPIITNAVILHLEVYKVLLRFANENLKSIVNHFSLKTTQDLSQSQLNDTHS